MEKSKVLERIKSIGIIPVVRASSGDAALAAVEAIKAGGLSVLEITMTGPRGSAIIEQIAKRYGDEVLVGAGTVLNAETAKDCLAAGAQIVSSPGRNLGNIAFSRNAGRRII